MDRLDFLKNALRGNDFSDEIVAELLELLTDRHGVYTIVARSSLQLILNEVWALRRELERGGEAISDDQNRTND